MSDLISKEAAERTIKDYYKSKIDEGTLNVFTILEMNKELCGIIRCIPTVENVPDINVGEWIPCSERLPEEHDSMFKKYKGTDKWDNAMFCAISNKVLVTLMFENGKTATDVSHTTDGKWSCEKNFGFNTKVVAWMPLPEPYKGE